MNIQLHIERLILDGVTLGPGQRVLVQAAVEAELTRLLAANGLDPTLATGGALPRVQANSIHLAAPSQPANLGNQIAGAVYSGIGQTQKEPK